jgi:hypothetical protein
MSCLNKSLPLVQDALKVIKSEPALAYVLSRLGNNPTLSDVLNKYEELGFTISNTLYDVNPTISEKEIEILYENYVNLMDRKREGKSIDMKKFKYMLENLQVFRSKQTHIFGEWDAKNNIFKARLMTSPNLRELYGALDVLSKNVDVVASVPEDIGKMLLKKKYVKLNVGKPYDFRGEMMVKNLYFSNPETIQKVFGKSAPATIESVTPKVNIVNYRNVTKEDKAAAVGTTQKQEPAVTDTTKRNEQDSRIQEKYFPTSVQKSSVIVKKIAESNHPLSKLAKQLLKYVEKSDVNIELVDGVISSRGVTYEKAAGLYDRVKSKIYIRKDASFKGLGSENTILHEVLHSLTTNLNGTNETEFQKLFQYVKENIKEDLYELTDIDEFITGIFTSAEFIKKLQALPATGKKYVNAWEQLLDYILGLFKINKGTTLYDEAFALATQAIDSEYEYNDYLQSDEYQKRLDDYLQKESGNDILQSAQSKKSEVEELFDSNPELANQVYEALGFKDNIKNPVYSAVFFNTNEITNKYKPVHSNVYSHHSTIEFKPSDISSLPIGENKNIKIVGRLTTDKVDVLIVENSLSKNKFPHITLSTAAGVKAFESNTEIENNQDKIVKLNDSINGVVGVFDGKTEVTNQITPQQKQQALQQYSAYLDSIFPNSKVKDIVYHGTDAEFEKFDKNLSGKKTGWGKKYKGIHFINNRSAAKSYTASREDTWGYLSLWVYLKQYAKSGKSLTEQEFKNILEDNTKLANVLEGAHYFGAVDIDTITYDQYSDYAKVFEKDKELDRYSSDNLDMITTDVTAKYENEKANIKSVILNIENPLIYDSKGRRYVQEIENIYSKLTSNNDGIIVENTLDRLNDDIGFEDNLQVVFEPEQIHILGSKQDIEGFKKFKENKSPQVDSARAAQEKWMKEEIAEFYEAVDGYNKGTMSIDDVGEETLGLFRTMQQFPNVKSLTDPYIKDIFTVLNSFDFNEQYKKFKDKKTSKNQASEMTLENLSSFIESVRPKTNEITLDDVKKYDNFFNYNVLLGRLKEAYANKDGDKVFSLLKEISFYDYDAYKLVQKLKRGTTELEYREMAKSSGYKDYLENNPDVEKLPEAQRIRLYELDNVKKQIIKNSSLNKVNINKMDLLNNPKIYNELDTELNKTLATFLSKFGIKTEMLEEMQEKLGTDSLGTVDILNKIIYANTNNLSEYPQQAGYLIAYMMQHNPLVQEIVGAMRKNPSNFPGAISNSGMFRGESKDDMLRAVGDMIANDLFKKTNTEVPEGLRAIISRLISQFFNFFTREKMKRINRNISIISDNILLQNQSLITASQYKPGAVGKKVGKISLEEALKSDEFGNSIVEKMADYFILTGSIIFAEQGTAYRPSENQIHDLDWVSPYSVEETIKVFENLYPDNQKIRTIEDENGINRTDTWVVPPSGHFINNLVLEGETKKVQSYDIIEYSTGNVVSVYNGKSDSHTGIEAKVIDIFTYSTEEARQKDMISQPFTLLSGKTLRISDWRVTFDAKLRYGRLKDIWDYNRFIPTSNIFQEDSRFDKSEKVASVNMDDVIRSTRDELIEKGYWKPEGRAELITFKYKFDEWLEGFKKSMKDKYNTVGQFYRIEKIGTGSNSWDKIVAIRSDFERLGNGVTEADYFQLTSNAQKAANKELDAKVQAFLEKIGVSIQSVNEIRDRDGNIVNGIAKANMLNKIIQVVEGRAAVDTLPEEAAHFFVEMLGEGHPLYKEMFSKINNYDVYKATLEEYKDRKEYKNSDGTVNIDKIKKEAIGKLIAEHIIRMEPGAESESKLVAAINWWQKLWEYVKSFFQDIEENPFEEAATKILMGDTSDLDSAPLQDEDYYQLVDPLQGLMLDQSRINLDNSIDARTGQKRHIYTYDGVQAKGSVTSVYVDRWLKKIFKTDNRSDVQKMIDLAKAEQGDVIHEQIQDIIKSWTNDDGTRRRSQAPLRAKVDPKIYSMLNNFIQEIMSQYADENTIFKAEVKVFDKKTNIAGSIDLIVIKPDGEVDIYDWKTQEIFKNQTDLKTYKEPMYRIQLENYRKILEAQYGFTKFGKIRAIPIATQFNFVKGPTGNVQVGSLKNIEIGPLDAKLIPEEKSYLLPVTLRTESTGDSQLDKLMTKLYGIYDKIDKSKYSGQELFKRREELNQLRLALRDLQLKQQIDKLVDIGLLQYKKYSDMLTSNTLKGKDIFEAISILKVFGDSGVMLYELREEMFENMDKTDPKAVAAFESMNKRFLVMSSKIGKLISDIEEYRGIQAQELGEKRGIMKLLDPEKAVGTIKGLFSSLSNITQKSFRVFSGLLRMAQNVRDAKFDKAAEKLQTLKDNFTTWAGSKGMSTDKAMEMILNIDAKGNWNGNFLSKNKPEFYTERTNAINTEDYEWFGNNIEFDDKKYDKALEEQIKFIKSVAWAADEKVNAETIEKRIKEWKDLHNVYNENFTINVKALTNENNRFITPQAKWHTTKWTELNKKENAPLLEMYNYFQSLIRQSEKNGMLDKYSPHFIPSVLADKMDQLVFGDVKGVFSTRGIFENLEVDSGTKFTPEVDPTNGQVINRVPVYFTKDMGVEREDGTIDYSKKSRDLFKVFGIWAGHMYNYEAMTGLEDDALLLVEVERNKGLLVTDNFNNVIIEGGNVKVATGDNVNKRNAELLADFVNYYLYDRANGRFSDAKISNPFSKNPNKKEYSVLKSAQALVKFFGLKTLALNVLSGTSNFVGGKGNALFMAQKGIFFTKSSWAKGMQLATGDRKAWAALKYLNILQEGNQSVLIDDLSLSNTNRLLKTDNLFIIQRTTDKAVQYPIAMALMLNHMVEDGKIIDIQQFVKAKYDYNNTFYNLPDNEQKILRDKIDAEVKELQDKRSLYVIGKVDEKTKTFEIPGIDKESETMSEFKSKIKGVTKKILGNNSRDDINGIRTTMIGTAAMQFRNWMPEMVEDRFGGLQYDDELGVWTYGKINQFARDMFSTRLPLLLKSIITGYGSNATELAKQGYERLKREAYEQGEDFTMTEGEFIDMYVGNLKSTVTELLTITSFLAAIFSIGALAGDDEDDDAKGMKAYLARALSKYKSEFLFYYNPLELTHIVNAPLPAIGLAEDMYRFLGAFTNEIGGQISGDEDTLKAAKPLKYFYRMMPIAKEAMLLMAVFDNDFRKDWDIQVNVQSGRH